MEKIYLKDMKYEDVEKLIKSNKEFIEEHADRLYEDNMFLQEEEGNNMFGNNWSDYIELRDNYSSFYLRLKDWSRFIDNLDSDYLCSKGIELYNYIMEKKKIFDNMEQYTNRYDNLEEHLENKCAELLDICEEQLHEYEKYPSEDEIVNAILDCEWYLEREYYTDKDMKKICYDVAYTKTFE